MFSLLSGLLAIDVFTVDSQPWYYWTLLGVRIAVLIATTVLFQLTPWYWTLGSFILYVFLTKISQTVFAESEIVLTKFLKLADPLNYAIQLPGMVRSKEHDHNIIFGISTETLFVVYALVFNLIAIPTVIVQMICTKDLEEAWWCYVIKDIDTLNQYLCPPRTLRGQLTSMCNNDGIYCLQPEHTDTVIQNLSRSPILSVLLYTYIVYILLFWRHI